MFLININTQKCNECEEIKELIKLCHYINLQALWAEDN